MRSEGDESDWDRWAIDMFRIYYLLVGGRNRLLTSDKWFTWFNDGL